MVSSKYNNLATATPSIQIMKILTSVTAVYLLDTQLAIFVLNLTLELFSLNGSLVSAQNIR